MSSHKIPNRTILIMIVAAIIAIILLGLLLIQGLDKNLSWHQWWPHFTLQEIIFWIRDAGHWGVLISISLMVLHSFIPFPAELVAIANGMIYGPLWGTIITWSGAMLGASLAFYLTKRLGAPFVKKLLNDKQQSLLEHWQHQHAAGVLLFSRFIPVIAFNLINYAAGLANISWWTFLWTTGLGILPLTSLMVIMGNQIHTLSWPIWLLLLLAGLFIWFFLHRYLQKMIHETQ